MKFSEKLKAKLRDRNFKKGAIKAATIAVLATAVVTFAACNKTGQTPTPSPTPTPTPGPGTSYTASQILEENTAYNKLNMADVTNEIFSKIKENVAKQYNVSKEDVEINDIHFDSKKADTAIVVATIEGKKVIAGCYSDEIIGKVRGANKKDLVLEEAGYTADQKFEESQTAEVDAKFTQAVQKILDEVKAIENITPERVNEIFAGVSDINLPSSFTDGYDFAVVSGVREDGTVVVFTGKNGKFEDHVLSVDGKENMTNEEILAAIKSGKGFSQTTRTIDPSKKYEAPALEEIQVQYVDFDTVYNEIFGKGYTLASPTKLLENALPNIFDTAVSTNLILFDARNDGLTLYVEMLSQSGVKSFRKAEYRGSDYENISKYLNSYQEMSENFKQYVENKFMPEKIEVGSQEETTLKTNMASFKNDVESGTNCFEGLNKSDFSRSNMITNTTDKLDQPAFGAKLCEGKEVIATYIGALGAKQLNDQFGTGYVKGFDTATIYKENGQVKIYKTRVIVPYYNNDSNEDSYNRYVEKSTFYLVDESTEVVDNPVIATENGKNAEYNISFESEDPQLVDIASSAISQWLKNEEDSLSR